MVMDQLALTNIVGTFMKTIPFNNNDKHFANKNNYYRNVV